MTKKEYKRAIGKLVSRDRDVPLKAIQLIDEAVREFPLDAELWQQRATLIQMGPKSGPHTLEDAQASYFTALHLDPENSDIVEDIGHFFDAVMADEREGRKWFAKARKIKANKCTEHTR